MADAPVEQRDELAVDPDAPALEQAAEKARLTFRRLAGLDRSGPPPPQTLGDQPWNVWTIPNAIGFVRFVLIPVFLVLALSSDNGTDALPAVIFAVISWSDYFDGMAARITGQYSRLGALLDPSSTACSSSPASSSAGTSSCCRAGRSPCSSSGSSCCWWPARSVSGAACS